MTGLDAYLEKIWNDLLSRERETIIRAYRSLDPASQAEVRQHLHKMETEPGWHPEQVISARIALEALQE
jgi:hypothetical protein